MMNMVTGPGVVIYRKKHLERDHRIKVFHKNAGKMIVTIKGSQRPQSKLKAFQQPFSISDFHISIPAHGTFGRLIGGRLMKSHHPIQQDIKNFSVASRCCEVMDHLFPYRAPSEEGFIILSNTLGALQFSKDSQTVWVFFLLQLLKALGHGDYLPEIIKFLNSEEHDGVVNWHKTGQLPHLSQKACEPCVHFMEDRIQSLLQRPLKTEILHV